MVSGRFGQLATLLNSNGVIAAACAAPVVIVIACRVAVRRCKPEAGGEAVVGIGDSSLVPFATGGRENRA